MSRSFSNYSAFVVSILIMVSCSPDHLSPEELTAYLLDEGNGVLKATESEGTKIEVTYRPADLWVHQELGDKAEDTEVIARLQKKYDQYIYFVVSLSKNDREALHQVSGGFGQYSELVQTLSFRMPEYVTLTTARQDTIPVGDFMLNRTYGMSNSTDLLFVFNREKVKENEWIQFNLNEFGLGVGNQRFRFKTKDLNDVPKIYYDE